MEKVEERTKSILKSDKIGLIVVMVFLCIVLTMITHDKIFATKDNFINILLNASLVGTVAAGETVVLLSGGMDLSIATNIAFQGSLVAVLITRGMQPAFAIILTLLCGIFTGAINAFFISEIKVPPFITTLGTQQVFKGLGFLVSGGSAVYIQNQKFCRIGSGKLFGIPNPVIQLLIVFLVIAVLLNKTVIGRTIYVIGGNEKAARLSGIKTRRYNYFIYMLSGFCAALGGIVLAARMTSGQPTAAVGVDMQAITGAVLGGTALTGGVGGIGGTLLGVLIMSIFQNGLLLLNVNSFYQYIANGLLLLFAVTFDALRTKYKKS